MRKDYPRRAWDRERRWIIFSLIRVLLERRNPRQVQWRTTRTMRGPSRCSASTASSWRQAPRAATSACGPTCPRSGLGRRGCRWEGSGRRSATSRSLRMPRWPGQRQRLKAFVIFAARESRLRAIQVLVRDPISIGVTSLSPIHHRSYSHSHSLDLGQENVPRKRLSPRSRCPASTKALVAYC